MHFISEVKIQNFVTNILYKLRSGFGSIPYNYIFENLLN
jgi:hypothetical protein